MERSIRFGLLLAPVLALTLALGSLYWLPGAASGHAAPVPAGAGPPARSVASLVKAGEPIELVVKDVVPIEEAGTHAVLLVSRDQAFLLPLFVTEEAAVSIAFRLAERASPHPLSADLLDDMVVKLGGTVTRVQIDDVQDDIYTSQITIEQGDKRLLLAARPSDAIAMALTGKARIFCHPKVMAEAGITRQELESLGGPAEEPGVGGAGPEGEAPPPDESNIRL